jgi:hypothetical protein
MGWWIFGALVALGLVWGALDPEDLEDFDDIFD